MIRSGKHTSGDSAYFKAPYLRQDIKSVFSVRLIYLNSGIDNISFPHEPFLIYPCSPADHIVQTLFCNHSSNSSRWSGITYTHIASAQNIYTFIEKLSSKIKSR